MTFISRVTAFCRATLLVGLTCALTGCDRGPASSPTPPTATHNRVDDATVRKLCSQCHLFTEPTILPRSEWRDRISKMVQMPGYGSKVRQYVNPQAVITWYEQRAPETLDLPVLEDRIDAGPLKWKIEHWKYAAETERPIVTSNVQLVDLLGGTRDGKTELLACDMRNGLLLLGQPQQPTGELRQIAQIGNPARISVVDLDGDGKRDLLVADLGSFTAIDHNLGTVTWLQNQGNGSFTPVVLAKGLSRVADVRAADLDADGDLDLTVAEFGWRRTGRVLVLERNERKGPLTPDSYRLHQLDQRHGAIHVPTVDLNGDGRLDIVALIAQEHEAVILYLNKGGMSFEAQTLYQAPHPSWGSSGLQLVDLDADDDIDMLVTNGDTMDDARLKPGHGVRWLENTGQLKFAVHDLARLYGVHRAEAGDLDNDGDLDIVACGFISQQKNVDRDDLLADLKVPSVLWLEQTQPRHFRARPLEAHLCNHPTLAVGDADNDGDVDVVIGNNSESASSSPVELWRNIHPPANSERHP